MKALAALRYWRSLVDQRAADPDWAELHIHAEGEHSLGRRYLASLLDVPLPLRAPAGLPGSGPRRPDVQLAGSAELEPEPPTARQTSRLAGIWARTTRTARRDVAPRLPGRQPDSPRAASRLTAALPMVATLLILALGWFRGPASTLEPVLVAVPALAAVSSLRTWYPLVAGAWTAAAGYGLAVHDPGTPQSVHRASLVAIVLVSLLSWVSLQLKRRQERELADAQLVAEIARRVLLRHVPDRVGTVRIAVRYVAAVATQRLGGDIYEVINTRHGVRAIVGDVRGRGMHAVEAAAAVLGAFREAAHREETLERVALWLTSGFDRWLQEHDEQGTADAGELVSLVLIEIHPDGVAEVVNFGHPAPLLLSPGEPARLLDQPLTEPPIGVLHPHDVRPSTQRVSLGPGDRVLLYTDGALGARDRIGRFFPLRERFSASTGTPVAVLDRLHHELLRHTGGQPADDAAMVLLENAPLHSQRTEGSESQIVDSWPADVPAKTGNGAGQGTTAPS